MTKHFNSVPRLGTLLFAVVAIFVICGNLTSDGMAWFFVMQAIAFPASMALKLFPIPWNIPRALDHGIFYAVVVLNGAVVYLTLFGLAAIWKALRRRGERNDE